MNNMQRNTGGTSRRSEGCRREEECRSLPVFAYVPMQEIDCVYEPEVGFGRGTLFPALDKPFLAGGCA